MKRLIECVPNFSEGRDRVIIDRIADAIATGDGVRLLDVDPGHATNRTVMTFAGEPEAVVEAAVSAASVASELIDMSQHSGEHPRFGALDVCPLVPISGITMDETVEYAETLAARLGDELGLTVYRYEHAASHPGRRNLADVRAGEYEGLAQRLDDPEWQPDHGPAAFNPRSGATAVGARPFLIAYNVNLNTTSTRRANAIAFDVREKGRVKRIGDPLTGEIARSSDGEPEWIPGSLKSVKAIGWYIDEYGIAQISMNLTDLSVTPVHVAFDECAERARDRGVRVTGSELVGLVPLDAMLEAGRSFLRKQHRSTGVSDSELIKIAVRSMGLDEVSDFEPTDKIIEYALDERRGARLVDLTLRAFVEETASESPAPGGGSVAAALGALGAALATMVANLGSHRRGWDDRWEEFSDWADRGKACHDRLLRLVDEDTEAFEAIMAAWRLPDDSEHAHAARRDAIQRATVRATEVPLGVMEAVAESVGVIRAMAESGMASAVSDAGVAALCARSAAMGAHLNVRINARDLDDEVSAQALLARAEAIAQDLRQAEADILSIVDRRL